MPRPKDSPQSELFQAETFGSLIPRKAYAKALGVHPRTAVRYEKLGPAFPKVIYRNGRAHVTDVALEAYKRALMARGFTVSGTFPAVPHREPENPEGKSNMHNSCLGRKASA